MYCLMNSFVDSTNLHKSETEISKTFAIFITVSRDGFEKATSILPTKFSDNSNLSANSC